VPGTGEKALYSASDKLRGKRALITGGDSGIGRAVAILFAMEGARVAIAYLPAEEADAAHTREQIEKNGGQAILLPGDVSTSRQCRDIVERAVSELGGIDILVNNAAYREEKADIADITDEQWYMTFRTNIDACFHITKAALPHLAAGASVINSTSVDAYVGVPTRVDYAASKGAVVAFTRALSNQLIKRGIRVNAVAAGPTWTPMLAASGAGAGGGGEEETAASKAGGGGGGHHKLGYHTPMDRLGQPSEVATSYVFLASADSVFMSGQTLHPNGGIVVNG